MVLLVMKWDIHPDKADAYLEWTQGAIGRTLATPGVVEFRAYRPATGSSQAVTTYEFADMATCGLLMPAQVLQALLLRYVF